MNEGAAAEEERGRRKGKKKGGSEGQTHDFKKIFSERGATMETSRIEANCIDDYHLNSSIIDATFI